jgi:hypothetical protein
MRYAAAVGVGLVLLVTACTPRWNFLRKDKQEREDVVTAAPTVEQLVAYLNDNSSRLQSLRCEDLTVTVSQGLKPGINLRGQMICQQPRNFRMSAEIFSKTEVELGSNSDEFWYWVRRNEPPYQFHCAYKDLEQGRVQQMPFPFQPDWLLEALGMAAFGPPNRYKLLDEPPYLKLVERVRGPQGNMVRKVIVLRRRPVRPPAPQVTDFLLLDDQTGKEICSAKIQEVYMDRTKGGLVPRRLVVNWPEQKARLAMRLDTVAANINIPPGSPAFVRRPMQGFPAYDLAAGRIDGLPTGLERVGGLGMPR